MEDLISRMALLEYKTLIPGFVGEYVHVRDILDAPAVSGEQTRWIPVTERLPDKSGYYLYRADSPQRGLQNGIGVSYFMHKAKTWKKVYNPCVTHWMPLPEPPKEV